MAIKINSVGQSSNLKILDAVDRTMADGAVLTLEIDGSYCNLDSEGIRRLENAIEMIKKNERGG